jgi:hypothetical protein
MVSAGRSTPWQSSLLMTRLRESRWLFRGFVSGKLREMNGASLVLWLFCLEPCGQCSLLRESPCHQTFAAH